MDIQIFPSADLSCHGLVILFLFSALRITGGVELQPLSHIIPEGTQSVNGSDVDGGCEVPVILVRRCGVPNSDTESFLTDGIIPVLNTTGNNWTSELVTVRKNSATVAVTYDHILLAFDFKQHVSLTSITLSLFNCPQWDIGAPVTTVYGDENGSSFFNFDPVDPYIISLTQTNNVQSSCDNLVPVTITLHTNTKYKIWYILVSFETQQNVDWVFVGEVQFFSTPQQPPASTIISDPSIATPSSSPPQLSVSIISEPEYTGFTATTTAKQTMATYPTTVPGDAEGDSSPTVASAVVVGAVVGGTMFVVTVLLLLLLVIIVLILVHKRRARPTEKEKEDPFYDYVLPPHMPAIPLSGDSVQLKENTAYNTTEVVTSPQVQPNIAYGTVLHWHH